MSFIPRSGKKTGFKLRDYQLECLETIRGRYRDGLRRQLISLPTGSGKTVIFAEFPMGGNQPALGTY